MPALGEYSNVENTALEILIAKGYRVWMDEKGKRVYAELGGWDFIATSLVALLGLIAIYEHHAPDTYREYWWRIDGALDYRNLTRQEPKYTPVWSRSSG